MFDWVLNTPLMMTVARYLEKISNKTEILFLLRKAHSIFILDNGSTYKLNRDPNEIVHSCLKNQTEKTTIL